MWNVIKKVKRKRWQQGFSIIEAMLSLILFSILMGSFFFLFTSMQRSHRLHVTRNHLNAIKEALAQHFLHYGHLPYPIDVKTGENMILSEDRKGMVGGVPYRALGLSRSSAKDGHGYWITYAVDAHLVSFSRSGPNIHSICRDAMDHISALRVMDGDAASVSDHLTKDALTLKDRQNGIAFVLISHGPHGHGALLSQGGRRPVTAAASECKRANCRDRLVFCSALNAQDVGTYDDDLHWVTQHQLLHLAGINCKDFLYEEDGFPQKQYAGMETRPGKSTSKTPSAQHPKQWTNPEFSQ